MCAVKWQRKVVRHCCNQGADEQAKRGAEDNANSEIINENDRGQNWVEPKYAVGDGVTVQE
ncbi:hypothetical protein VCR4J2_250134 [Vibrio coralliirubri]|nr:hypothetical protein VCR4J2_250134 [Vibrio coralliirubri]